MALTATSIYSSQSIGAGTGTALNPIKVDVSSVTGNGLAFNFVLTSGSTSPGPNAIVKFHYAFSMNSYTGTDIPTTVGNSASIFRLKFSQTASAVLDITTQFITPILGNNLYCWLDIESFASTATLNASAIGLVYPIAQ